MALSGHLHMQIGKPRPCLSPAAPVSAPQPSTSGRPFSCSNTFQPRRANWFLDGKSTKSSLVSLAVADNQLTDFLGLPADKLQVRVDPQRGLVLNKAVSRGQTLLSVPASRWITVDTVAASGISQYVSRLQPWLQVALFILHEKAKSRSQWQPYIDSLLETLDSPLFWSDDELEGLLGGTQLLDAVSGYRDFFHRQYAELEQSVFSPNRGVFPADAFSERNFVWAAAILRARVHAPLERESLALVPLADLVQHQRGQGAVWSLSQGGFGRGEKALVVEAQRDYAAGEAVTMDYGPSKLDADLLLNYGVLDDYVTRAGFTLTLELPPEDRFFDDKADILDINGFQESQEFVLRADEEPPEDLLAYLRIVNLSGPDAFLLESLFRNEAWGHLQKPVSLENETAIFSSMIEGCREALSGYGSSVSDDKASLRSTQTWSRQERALRIRIGEKEALAATLQFFEERVGKLERLEYYQERRLKGLGLLDEDGRSTFDSFFKDGIA